MADAHQRDSAVCAELPLPATVSRRVWELLRRGPAFRTNYCVTELEDVPTMSTALSKLLEMTRGGWGGRGVPSCLMTDDGAAIRPALKASFRGVPQLLCIFHIGQAMWRWSCSNLGKQTRAHMAGMFTQGIYGARNAIYT